MPQLVRIYSQPGKLRTHEMILDINRTWMTILPDDWQPVEGHPSQGFCHECKTNTTFHNRVGKSKGPTKIHGGRLELICEHEYEEEKNG